MSTSTEDFVQIDFITSRHTLSIALHSDGLSIGAWHSIVKTLSDDEILVGYDLYDAKPTSFSFEPGAFEAIRVKQVHEGFIAKYEARQENRINAKNTVTF
jgi:hypothetical protein